MQRACAVTNALQDESWALPNPPTLDDRLAADGSSHREFLEDVEIELLAWMNKLASDTGAPNPAAGEGWSSAVRDLERVLAAQGCTFLLFAFAVRIWLM